MYRHITRVKIIPLLGPHSALFSFEFLRTKPHVFIAHVQKKALPNLTALRQWPIVVAEALEFTADINIFVLFVCNVVCFLQEI